MLRIQNAPPAADTDATLAIEGLLDRTFGPDRKAKTSYRYRAGIRPVDALALVAFENGRLVGTIRFWPIRIGARPALLLGPLGVAPERQGAGIGRGLVRTGLARAAALGHEAVLLVGDPDYYRRLGFRPAAPLGIVMPGEAPERLMVQELAPGALDGLAGEVRRADGSAIRGEAGLLVEIG
jgi:predicted N-acetyltransferase YhbS